MTHAIIRGKNGRRYEVDFGDSPVCVEVHASEKTVEIFVKLDQCARIPGKLTELAETGLPGWACEMGYRGWSPRLAGR
jgi:hypothetical protein